MYEPIGQYPRYFNCQSETNKDIFPNNICVMGHTDINTQEQLNSIDNVCETPCASRIFEFTDDIENPIKCKDSFTNNEAQNIEHRYMEDATINTGVEQNIEVNDDYLNYDHLNDIEAQNIEHRYMEDSTINTGVKQNIEVGAGHLNYEQSNDYSSNIGNMFMENSTINTGVNQNIEVNDSDFIYYKVKI